MLDKNVREEQRNLRYSEAQIINEGKSSKKSLKASDNILNQAETQLHMKSLQILSGKLNQIMKDMRTNKVEQVQNCIRGVIKHAIAKHNLSEYLDLRYPNILSFILKYHRFRDLNTRKMVVDEIKRVVIQIFLSASPYSDLEEMGERVTSKFQQIYVKYNTQKYLKAQKIARDHKQQQQMEEIKEMEGDELESRSLEEQRNQHEQISDENKDKNPILQQIREQNRSKIESEQKIEQTQRKKNIEIQKYLQRSEIEFAQIKDLFSKELGEIPPITIDKQKIHKDSTPQNIREEAMNPINESINLQQLQTENKVQIEPQNKDQFLRNAPNSQKQKVSLLPDQVLETSKVKVAASINKPQVVDLKIAQQLEIQQRKKLAKQIINLQAKDNKMINLEQKRTAIQTVNFKHVFYGNNKKKQTVIIDEQPGMVRHHSLRSKRQIQFRQNLFSYGSRRRKQGSQILSNDIGRQKESNENKQHIEALQQSNQSHLNSEEPILQLSQNNDENPQKIKQSHKQFAQNQIQSEMKQGRQPDTQKKVQQMPKQSISIDLPIISLIQSAHDSDSIQLQQ